MATRGKKGGKEERGKDGPWLASFPVPAWAREKKEGGGGGREGGSGGDALTSPA